MRADRRPGERRQAGQALQVDTRRPAAGDNAGAEQRVFEEGHVPGGMEEKGPQSVLLELQEAARREPLTRPQCPQDLEPAIPPEPGETSVRESPPVQRASVTRRGSANTTRMIRLRRSAGMPGHRPGPLGMPPGSPSVPESGSVRFAIARIVSPGERAREGSAGRRGSTGPRPDTSEVIARLTSGGDDGARGGAQHGCACRP
jgi:hypothetical protein